MFSHYYKQFVRNFLRNKGVSFINLGGLILGLVTVLVALTYTTDELTYDASFSDSSNIFRIVSGAVREVLIWP